VFLEEGSAAQRINLTKRHADDPYGSGSSAGGPAPAMKGATVREFLLWYEKQRGTNYHQGLQRRLAGSTADLVWFDRPALGLVGTDWYPVELIHAVLDTLAEECPNDMHKLIAEASEAAVAKLTRGIYQYLFRMVASPKLYARHIQRAWNLLHTTGTRKIVITSAGLADSTIEHWPGHHRWLCVVTTETMRATFHAMGARNVVVERVGCVSTGAPLCRALVRWDD
jgi:hypothetical protein